LEKICKNIRSSLRARRKMKNLVNIMAHDTTENTRSSNKTPLATGVERETISRRLIGSTEFAASSMEDVPKEDNGQEN